MKVLNVKNISSLLFLLSTFPIASGLTILTKSVDTIDSKDLEYNQKTAEHLKNLYNKASIITIKGDLKKPLLGTKIDPENTNLLLINFTSPSSKAIWLNSDNANYFARGKTCYAEHLKGTTLKRAKHLPIQKWPYSQIALPCKGIQERKLKAEYVSVTNRPTRKYDIIQKNNSTDIYLEKFSYSNKADKPQFRVRKEVNLKEALKLYACVPQAAQSLSTISIVHTTNRQKAEQAYVTHLNDNPQDDKHSHIAKVYKYDFKKLSGTYKNHKYVLDEGEFDELSKEQQNKINELINNMSLVLCNYKNKALIALTKDEENKPMWLYIYLDESIDTLVRFHRLANPKELLVSKYH